jgi:hypothetical protein
MLLDLHCAAVAALAMSTAASSSERVCILIVSCDKKWTDAKKDLRKRVVRNPCKCNNNYLEPKIRAGRHFEGDMSKGAQLCG